MRIGAAAKRLGVSPSHLRRLERWGKLPRPRRLRVGTRWERRYTVEDVKRIEAVLYPYGGPTEAAPGPVAPVSVPMSPPEALVAVQLARRHTINGVPYGPGVVQVPRDLARVLEEGEWRAQQVGS